MWWVRERRGGGVGLGESSVVGEGGVWVGGGGGVVGGGGSEIYVPKEKITYFYVPKAKNTDF